MTTPSAQALFRALVVDDEAITRGMVVMALLDQGFTCDVATDGEKAKALLEERHYDLLVTDLRMPYMDGRALAIAALGGNAPPNVIVHTAHEDPRTVKDFIELGVDDVIKKPTDYAVFAAKARGLVARRKVESRKPTCADSPPAIDQPIDNAQPEVDSAETPAGLAQPALEISEEGSNSPLPSKVTALGSSQSVATAKGNVATKTVRVRKAPVFKVSDRSIQKSSVKQITEDKQTLTRGGGAAERKTVPSIPLLIPMLACIFLLTTAMVTLPQNRGLQQAVSHIPLHTAAAQYMADDLKLSTTGKHTSHSPSPLKVQQVASEKPGGVHKLQSRVEELAGDELLDEDSLAESDTESLTIRDSHHHLQTEDSLTLADESTDNTSALKRNRELQLAADLARLETAYLSDLPEIQKWLAPLLADGLSQPQRTGQLFTAVKGPTSLTALRRCGALTNSEEGLSRLARAMTYGNDRATPGFAPYTGGSLREEHLRYVLPASRLLLKYQLLLVEKGVLAE